MGFAVKIRIKVFRVVRTSILYFLPQLKIHLKRKSLPGARAEERPQLHKLEGRKRLGLRGRHVGIRKAGRQEAESADALNDGPVTLPAGLLTPCFTFCALLCCHKTWKVCKEILFSHARTHKPVQGGSYTRGKTHSPDPGRSNAREKVPGAYRHLGAAHQGHLAKDICHLGSSVLKQSRTALILSA